MWSSALQTRPYSIRVSSLKGGVGKTVISVNLAVLLSTLGYKVLLSDTDLTNPSAAFHFGIYEIKSNINDVMLGKAKLKNAIMKYTPTGLDILPGSLAGRFVPTPKQVDRVCGELRKMDYDFIIYDTSPGLISERELVYYDEMLIVTTPDYSSLYSVVRLAKAYEGAGFPHNLVVNRFRNNTIDLSISTIEEVYGDKAIGVLPEDESVQKSFTQRMPLYFADKNSPFSKALQKLSGSYISRRQSSRAVP